MQKPVKLLHSFQTFFKLIKTYCNEEVAMPALSIDEDYVYKKLTECQENVHLALSDDFNTCLAIDHLIELMNFINKQFQGVSKIFKEGYKKQENHLSAIE
jgi:cysteinyl-tRNA synthetase